MTRPIDADDLRARLSATAPQPARFAVPAAGASPPGAPPLDPRRLDELCGALGSQGVEALLKLLQRELVDRSAAIARLAAAADFVPLHHEAHSLKGAAMSMGAIGVGAAAAALEQVVAAPQLAAAVADLERHADLALAWLTVAIPPRATPQHISA